MTQEFIAFLTKNNVIGMAIGLLIATKVGELVKSLIEDLITPMIFAPLFKKLKVDRLEELSARGVLYGKVIARVIEFLIIAVVLFLIIRYSGIKTP